MAEHHDADYLKRTVGDALVKGMTEMVVAQPEDSVDFLGHFLLNYVKVKEAEAAAAGKAERTPDGDAALRIALDPPLCLDLAEAERPDRRTVLLAPCTAASPTWTTEAAPAASAPVATSDGWCLTIPAAETPDARFPFPVAAVRCEGGDPPPVAFFLTDG